MGKNKNKKRAYLCATILNVIHEREPMVPSFFIRRSLPARQVPAGGGEGGFYPDYQQTHH